MNKFNIYILAIGFLLITGCTTVPIEDIQVEAEADPKVKFSGYKSYAWLGSVGILSDPEGRWKQPEFDVDTEIRFLIDRELRKRGLSETSNKPDMLVAYAMGVDMDAIKVKENPETKKQMLKNAPKGALLVILVDPETQYVMWLGSASADVQKDPDTEIIKKRLDYAVSQMMKMIPK